MLHRSLRTFALTVMLLFGGSFALPAAAQTPYLGEVKCFAFNFVPIGWAALNGQILPINQYQALFALLGTQYGGDGVQNFALPDLRGRTIVATGSGPGLTPRIIGQSGGSETNTLAVANLPPHAHTFAPLGSTNDATSVSPAGQVASSKARTTLYTSPANLVNMASGVTSSTGSAVPVNGMQPYLTFTCAIALQGIFPSQQ